MKLFLSAGILSLTCFLLRYNRKQEGNNNGRHLRVLDAQPISPNFELEVSGARQIEEIEIDPTSALSKDILAITHNPLRRQIKVILSKDRYCHRPVLMGRLSGEALVMVKWLPQEPNSNVIIGTYDVPHAWKFYVEIIALFCEHKPDDYGACLVPGEKHRITAKNAVINTAIATDLLGYWKTKENVPLFTRWQPENCREEQADTKRCSGEGGPGDPLPFDRYHFHSYKRIQDLYKKFDTSLAAHETWSDKWRANAGYNCLRDTEEQCELCMIGSSHSNRIDRFLEILIGGKKTGRIWEAYPERVNDSSIKLLMDRCKNVLVGFGQWDIPHHKTLPDSFREHLTQLLLRLQQHPRVFGRSMHYSPLGDVKLRCPPKDNRNPLVIDNYNYAMKSVYGEMRREWIDTRWIDHVMWDSAVDWNHLHYKVEFVQAFYLADYFGILNE